MVVVGKPLYLKLTSDDAANRATAQAEYAIDGELVFAPKLTFDLR